VKFEAIGAGQDTSVRIDVGKEPTDEALLGVLAFCRIPSETLRHLQAQPTRNSGLIHISARSKYGLVVAS
jgi:hypothetical protein